MNHETQIGLIVETGLTFSQSSRGWTETKHIVELAEASGFDSIWVYDHPLRKEDWGTLATWECFSVLSALAAITSTIKLGVQVAKLGFRNPALLAKQAETIDEISAGRLILGLGWGAPELEAKTFGVPTDRTFSRFSEAFSVVRSLLKDGTASFHGHYYDIEDCELLPRGPRPHGLPIMVGVKGPKMMKLAARDADLIDCLQLDREDAPSQIFEVCEQVGRDPTTLQLVDTLWVRAKNDQKEWSICFDDLPRAVEKSKSLGYSQIILWAEPNELKEIDQLCNRYSSLF